MGQPKNKLYNSAETLFVEQMLTCKEISETLDISEQTLSKWRVSQLWDDKRTEMQSAPGKIRELLLKELERVAKGEKATIDADSLSKISKALSQMEGKVSIPVIISVFKMFDNYIAEIEPTIALKFIEYHKQFLHHRAEIESLR